MVKTGSLFSQILSLVDREVFGRIVRNLKAEKGAKGFSCWDQLVAMLFCQLAQAKSIREIEGGLRSCEGKLRHLGLESARVFPCSQRATPLHFFAPCFPRERRADPLFPTQKTRKGEAVCVDCCSRSPKL